LFCIILEIFSLRREKEREKERVGRVGREKVSIKIGYNDYRNIIIQNRITYLNRISLYEGKKKREKKE
jgi:hypothetical protein